MVEEATASRQARERRFGVRTRRAARSPTAAVPYRGPMRQDQIALQLYTLRRLSAVDLAGTLEAVAAAGYRAVELAGLPEIEPLDTHGLRVVASHEGIERLRDDAGAVAGRMTELGCPRLIVPWMPEADRATVAGVRRFAADVGGYARRLADDGIAVGYHNHDFEFTPLEGTTVWDVLLAALPAEIELELDVYWAAVGGRDPVTEIGAIADRVCLLHMKDRAAGSPPRDAPVGEGSLPFPAIVEAARAAGVAWYIVEQDEPVEPLANIGTSLRYLESLAR
jgi:sugar phosphate isomerase/epimerase